MDVGLAFKCSLFNEIPQLTKIVILWIYSGRNPTPVAQRIDSITH